MNNKSIRNIVVFIIVVIMSGWIGILVDSLLIDQPPGDSLGMGVWLVLPMLTAIAITLFSKGNWKDFGFLPNFKGNIKWYLIAFFIFPVVTAIVLIIGALTGWIDLSALDLRLFIPVVYSGFLLNFFIDIFDGPPLYGYLSSQLTKINLNDWKVYLIVGGLWGIWHAPYLLFFLSETDIQAVLPVSLGVFFIFFMITIVCWGVMYIELYRVTQSIWPGVILHMVEDALINPLVIAGYISIAAGTEIFISPICGIITSILYLLAGLGIRRYRIQGTFRTNT
ncbi:CPBP family intramembrane metalloprotease [Methanoplanus sp. FWC-SCC4]|uniref:CPBP family intramembrane metalloprotease n=1 Tax=Methanochimaera problematica TaxID=2609417 RepID=A0AA97FFY4_9EURY|nr:CPBP family glutamic-type intramembrane protease [Methanoplanus sp. FWC-SCC4]WOF16746.1 CPBP family intramembrane metalloprotease [Methanoplanus sp. FWC-SCC4]